MDETGITAHFQKLGWTLSRLGPGTNSGPGVLYVLRSACGHREWIFTGLDRLWQHWSLHAPLMVASRAALLGLMVRFEAGTPAFQAAVRRWAVDEVDTPERAIGAEVGRCLSEVTVTDWQTEIVALRPRHFEHTWAVTRETMLELLAEWDAGRLAQALDHSLPPSRCKAGVSLARL